MTSLAQQTALRAVSRTTTRNATRSVLAQRCLSTAAAPCAPRATTSVRRTTTALPARSTPSLAGQVRTLKNDAQQNNDSSWVKKGSVAYEELKPITEAPTGEITIIDVREPSETSQGMIPSAVNVPLSDFGRAFSTTAEGADFDKTYAFQRPTFDDKIIVYCRSGKRSQQALEEAQKRGWWNVRNYTGSWIDWNAQEEARGKQDD